MPRNTLALCPDCGKLITLIFPLHYCKPTLNFIRAKKAAARMARRGPESTVVASVGKRTLRRQAKP